MACWPKSLISTFCFRRATPDNTPKPFFFLLFISKDHLIAFTMIIMLVIALFYIAPLKKQWLFWCERVSVCTECVRAEKDCFIPSGLLHQSFMRHSRLFYGQVAIPGEKIELDVKESFLVFKIIVFFLNFNIHTNDFLLLGFYPLKMRSSVYFSTPKPLVRHSDSNAERELYTLLIY